MRPLAAPAEDARPDDEGSDELEGVPGERDAPLTPFEESPPEFDDELPTDPTFDIDLPSDDEDVGETEAAVDLPLGPDLSPAEAEEEAETFDDALGFIDATGPGESPSDVDDPVAHDASDGFDDGHTHVDELPSLGTDDGPELDEARFGPGLASADETELARTAKPWQVDFIAPDREHCSALCASRGIVVAGSSDLFWLDEGRETVVRIGLDGTRISSVALVGEDQKTALCVTAFGRLLRRARTGGDVERLVDWRRVAEASGSSAESLELRPLGAALPNSVLGRLTSGRLVRSDDMGTTFRMLDAEITALTISNSGEPVTVLTRDGARLGLSSDGGLTWEHLELGSPAREVASGEAPLVAASSGVVVLGDAERGVALSSDRGRTFRRVAGATNVTALAVGAIGGRPTAFAALYRETEDHSRLVEIDVHSGIATIGAVLTLPAADDPDTALELGRVERLLWDGERLWAAGAFGLARIGIPPARD